MSPRTPRPLALDFGRVLTRDPDPSTFDEILVSARLDRWRFQSAYQALRHDFDRGSLDAHQYWTSILHASRPGFSASEALSMVPALVEADFASWNQPRTEMHVVIQRALDQATPLAIVSNMPPGVGDRFVREWAWLGRIPHRFFSADFGLVKPHASFYRHVLEQTGWRAPDTLFVDDLAVNIEAAAREGFSVLMFTGSDSDLETIGNW